MNEEILTKLVIINGEQVLIKTNDIKKPLVPSLATDKHSVDKDNDIWTRRH